MSWATPPTWVTDDVVTAGRLNAVLGNDSTYMRGVGTLGRANFRLTGQTAVPVPAQTALLTDQQFGTLTFSNVIWDATGWIPEYQAMSGSPGPYAYVPLPTGISLVVARTTTVIGGTTGQGLWMSGLDPQTYGFQADIAAYAGTAAVAGYHNVVAGLWNVSYPMSQPEFNTLMVFGSHGGGSAVNIAGVVDAALLVGGI
jgi:hypothetical protein